MKVTRVELRVDGVIVAENDGPFPYDGTGAVDRRTWIELVVDRDDDSRRVYRLNVAEELKVEAV